MTPKLKNSRDCGIDTKRNLYLPPNYKIKTFFDMTHSYRSKYKEYPQNKFINTYENIY